MWLSHWDGELGSGRRIDLRSLTPSVHEITLRIKGLAGIQRISCAAVKQLDGLIYCPEAVRKGSG